MSQPTFDPRKAIPNRRFDANKTDFGRLLFIGGSRGMAGAISLSAMAALRSGAGLVKVATPDVCLETVAGFNPCVMTSPLPSDSQGRIGLQAREPLRALLAEATVLAVGPGLGRSTELTDLVAWLENEVSIPSVFDADALYAISNEANRPTFKTPQRIYTPHVGEFMRLLGRNASEGKRVSRAHLEELAKAYASERSCVLVLKGAGTFVTDGHRDFRNSTGNPGMATAGSGDVLTGVIAALIGVGLEPFEAAASGAYFHGLAGDLALEQLGQLSLTATDMVSYLPQAFRTANQE